jgi:hypothetical protein
MSSLKYVRYYFLLSLTFNLGKLPPINTSGNTQKRLYGKFYGHCAHLASTFALGMFINDCIFSIVYFRCTDLYERRF